MILDEPFPPDPRVENEALTLIDNNFEVFLFCISYSKKKIENESHKNIHIHRIYVPEILRKFSALAYTFPIYHLFLKKKIKRFIERYKIDIIHVHDIRIARSVFNIKTEKKIVLDLHENRPEIMKFYTWVNKFPGKFLVFPKIWKTFEKKYIFKSYRTIVVTDYAKRYYSENFGINMQKFIIVPNTVKTEFYTEFFLKDSIIKKYEDSFTLLYIGETGKRRGLETVINSLPLLVEQIPKIKFVIVGKSNDDHYTVEQIKKLKVLEYVDFEGWKDVSLFQSYIKACKIGISPLLRNIHHDTTYANKIFQYMAIGKPIIVSDCPPQAEIIKKYNCGLIFAAEDAKSFSETVLKMYKDEKLREIMGKNAENAVKKNLNWDLKSKDLLNLYKKANDEYKK